MPYSQDKQLGILNMYNLIHMIRYGTTFHKSVWQDLLKTNISMPSVYLSQVNRLWQGKFLTLYKRNSNEKVYIFLNVYIKKSSAYTYVIYVKIFCQNGKFPRFTHHPWGYSELSEYISSWKKWYEVSEIYALENFKSISHA